MKLTLQLLLTLTLLSYKTQAKRAWLSTCHHNRASRNTMNAFAGRHPTQVQDPMLSRTPARSHCGKSLHSLGNLKNAVQILVPLGIVSKIGISELLSPSNGSRLVAKVLVDACADLIIMSSAWKQ